MKNEKKMYKLKKKEEDCVYVSEHKVLNIFLYTQAFFLYYMTWHASYNVGGVEM